MPEFQQVYSAAAPGIQNRRRYSLWSFALGPSLATQRLSKAVLPSAFTHRPTLPASVNVESSSSIICLPSSEATIFVPLWLIVISCHRCAIILWKDKETGTVGGDKEFTETDRLIAKNQHTPLYDK